MRKDYKLKSFIVAAGIKCHYSLLFPPHSTVCKVFLCPQIPHSPYSLGITHAGLISGPLNSRACFFLWVFAFAVPSAWHTVPSDFPMVIYPHLSGLSLYVTSTERPSQTTQNETVAPIPKSLNLFPLLHFTT